MKRTSLTIQGKLATASQWIRTVLVRGAPGQCALCALWDSTPGASWSVFETFDRVLVTGAPQNL
jgi:hypothetical protein